MTKIAELEAAVSEQAKRLDAVPAWIEGLTVEDATRVNLIGAAIEAQLISKDAVKALPRRGFDALAAKMAAQVMTGVDVSIPAWSLAPPVEPVEIPKITREQVGPKPSDHDVHEANAVLAAQAQGRYREPDLERPELAYLLIPGRWRTRLVAMVERILNGGAAPSKTSPHGAALVDLGHRVKAMTDEEIRAMTLGQVRDLEDELGDLIDPDRVAQRQHAGRAAAMTTERIEPMVGRLR